jgi:hypothetical protein
MSRTPMLAVAALASSLGQAALAAPQFPNVVYAIAPGPRRRGDRGARGGFSGQVRQTAGRGTIRWRARLAFGPRAE